MAVQFVTPSQEACYGISQIWLRQMFHDAVEPRDDAPGFAIRVGEALVLTDVLLWQNPFGEDDTIIRSRACIVRGVDPTLLITRYLAETNAEVLFGAFGIDENRAVFFGHSIVGSTCDRLELQSSVASVAAAAIKYHGDVLDRSGGGVSALNE